MEWGKKEIQRLIQAMDEAFPEDGIALHYRNPLELLVATILSAQCTDERVNQVTASLFKKYRSAEDYARADLATLEQEIRPTGFFKQKARTLVACCRMLVEEFGGEVPQTMEALTRLPGVGRKTANVILGNCFGQPAIVVDTHVRRVSQRLGLTRSDDPDQIEQELAAMLPRETWTRTSHQILLHGRHICKARRPLCEQCRITALCACYQQQARPSSWRSL